MYQQEFNIDGLDLTLAREAQHLHDWKDMPCVDQLIQVLEESAGHVIMKTYFRRVEGRGRLFLEWPSLLHVNKAFRACVLYPQRSLFSDLDMSNAHSHICQYFSEKQQMVLSGLLEYLENKASMRKEFTDQGLKDDFAKKLWLSMLNSGSLRGWLFRLRSEYPGFKLVVSANMKAHCKRLETEIRELRERVLELPEWKPMLDDMVERNEHARTRKSTERVKRSAWNAVLCTIESGVIADLIDYVHAESNGRIVMPSYDGVLVTHLPDDFCWEGALNTGWMLKSQARWGYTFPMEVKDWASHMPKWLLEILRLRAAH